jgi:hypothetical protein
MPMPFAITAEDMKRAQVVQPGWYHIRCTKVKQGPGKKDPESQTTELNFVILDGPDKTAVGVPLRAWFSEKMPEMAIPFVQAITGKEVTKEGANFDFSMAESRECKGHVSNEKFGNRTVNKLDDFLPLS